MRDKERERERSAKFRKVIFAKTKSKNKKTKMHASNASEATNKISIHLDLIQLSTLAHLV